MNEKSQSSDGRAVAFAMAEHAELQTKLGRAAEDMYRTETVIPVSMAVIYAWLFKEAPDQIRDNILVYYVPIILPVTGLFRHIARYEYISLAEKYTKGIENYLYGESSNGMVGWENFLSDEHKTMHKRLRYSLWSGLTLLAILIAITKTLASYGIVIPEWI